MTDDQRIFFDLVAANPPGKCMAMPPFIVYHNACSDPCDMAIGPCCCGATHSAGEWRRRLCGATEAETLGERRGALVMAVANAERVLELARERLAAFDGEFPRVREEREDR